MQLILAPLKQIKNIDYTYNILLVKTNDNIFLFKCLNYERLNSGKLILKNNKKKINNVSIINSIKTPWDFYLFEINKVIFGKWTLVVKLALFSHICILIK